MTTQYITGARSVTLGVQDLSACVSFYEKVWGLERVPATEDTAYFKATRTRHPVLALRPRPSPELVDVAFQARDRASVDALYARVDKSLTAGSPHDHDTPGGRAYGFSFTATGLPKISIVAAGEGLPVQAEARMKDAPSRISHIVLNSPNRAAAAQFCQDVLGFALSDVTRSMHFLRCCADHHSLALSDGSRVALNHIAYDVPSLDSLMRGVARLQNAGFPLEWGVGRHGPGNNIFAYFLDPAGFVPEFTTEMEQVIGDRPTGTPADWDKFWKDRGVSRDQWGLATKISPRLAAAMER